ncbi:hypothetical protein LTR62_006290 [Meristemomyces frigidus]|uniref:Uncharacterized protein n=1 Tax=Meristemomyces frigidus TaxID=1508187 RepID=A0AAN7TC77_9PEZI|nr:hypothetical protein LTR62_006290 [Meristemomyces frigidus]
MAAALVVFVVCALAWTGFAVFAIEDDAREFFDRAGRGRREAPGGVRGGEGVGEEVKAEEVKVVMVEMGTQTEVAVETPPVEVVEAETQTAEAESGEEVTEVTTVAAVLTVDVGTQTIAAPCLPPPPVVDPRDAIIERLELEVATLTPIPGIDNSPAFTLHFEREANTRLRGEIAVIRQQSLQYDRAADDRVRAARLVSSRLRERCRSLEAATTVASDNAVISNSSLTTRVADLEQQLSDSEAKVAAREQEVKSLEAVVEQLGEDVVEETEAKEAAQAARIDSAAQNTALRRNLHHLHQAVQRHLSRSQRIARREHEAAVAAQNGLAAKNAQLRELAAQLATAAQEQQKLSDELAAEKLAREQTETARQQLVAENAQLAVTVAAFGESALARQKLAGEVAAEKRATEQAEAARQKQEAGEKAKVEQAAEEQKKARDAELLATDKAAKDAREKLETENAKLAAKVKELEQAAADQKEAHDAELLAAVRGPQQVTAEERTEWDGMAAEWFPEDQGEAIEVDGPAPTTPSYSWDFDNNEVPSIEGQAPSASPPFVPSPPGSVEFEDVPDFFSFGSVAQTAATSQSQAHLTGAEDVEMDGEEDDLPVSLDAVMEEENLYSGPYYSAQPPADSQPAAALPAAQDATMSEDLPWPAAPMLVFGEDAMVVSEADEEAEPWVPWRPQQYTQHYEDMLRSAQATRQQEQLEYSQALQQQQHFAQFGQQQQQFAQVDQQQQQSAQQAPVMISLFTGLPAVPEQPWFQRSLQDQPAHTVLQDQGGAQTQQGITGYLEVGSAAHAAAQFAVDQSMIDPQLLNEQPGATAGLGRDDVESRLRTGLEAVLRPASASAQMPGQLAGDEVGVNNTQVVDQPAATVAPTPVVPAFSFTGASVPPAAAAAPPPVSSVFSFGGASDSQPLPAVSVTQPTRRVGARPSTMAGPAEVESSRMDTPPTRRADTAQPALPIPSPFSSGGASGSRPLPGPPATQPTRRVGARPFTMAGPAEVGNSRMDTTPAQPPAPTPSPSSFGSASGSRPLPGPPATQPTRRVGARPFTMAGPAEVESSRMAEAAQPPVPSTSPFSTPRPVSRPSPARPVYTPPAQVPDYTRMNPNIPYPQQSGTYNPPAPGFPQGTAPSATVATAPAIRRFPNGTPIPDTYPPTYQSPVAASATAGNVYQPTVRREMSAAPTPSTESTTPAQDWLNNSPSMRWNAARTAAQQTPARAGSSGTPARVDRRQTSAFLPVKKPSAAARAANPAPARAAPAAPARTPAPAPAPRPAPPPPARPTPSVSNSLLEGEGDDAKMAGTQDGGEESDEDEVPIVDPRVVNGMNDLQTGILGRPQGVGEGFEAGGEEGADEEAEGRAEEAVSGR